MSTEPSRTETPNRRLGTDFLLIAAIFGVLALLAFAYARPWLTLSAPAGADLQRYVPLADGQSIVQVTLDEAGAPIRWTSSTMHRLPVQQALSGRPRMSVGAALSDRYPGTIEEGVIPGVEVWEIRSRLLEKNGDLINESVLFVREDEGDLLLNIQRTPGVLDLTFRPALWTGPMQFTAGESWSSSGIRSDSLPYYFGGQMVARGPHTTTLGLFEDCWQVQTRTIISSTDVTQTEPLVDSETTQWNCADVGTVEFTSRSIDGALERTVLLASTMLPDRVVDPTLLPPLTVGLAVTGVISSPATPIQIEDPTTWTLSRLARTIPGDQSAAHSSIAPLYLPGEPPLVLSATRSSDLTAFTLSGAVRWRFHTGGTIYSTPVFDPARGQIYFGSSDKYFYAVDYNGFFVWSFRTRDNVATRPLLIQDPAGDLVIFGSEDRTLYAVDAARGVLRWHFETGGPIVSGPAQVESGHETWVLFGNDDGAIYGLNGADGALRWQYGVEDAVEAPIVVVDGIALVAGRDGALYALDAASGVALWQSEVTRHALRTSPVVAQDMIYVVDDARVLHALDRVSGRKLWSRADNELVGTPVLLQSEMAEVHLVAAGYEGGIYRLDADGQLLDEWAGASVRMQAIEGPNSSFEFGPTYGGGALWLADDSGLVYRLGPAMGGGTGDLAGDPATNTGIDTGIDTGMDTGIDTVHVQLTWMQQAIVFPFRQNALTYTPLAYGERNLVLDHLTNLYSIDPTTGETEHIGTVAADGLLQPAEPVLVDDSLLLFVDDQLYAVDPKSGAVRWQHMGLGQTFTPVASDGEVAVWLTSAPPEGSQPAQGALVALDVANGDLRWEIPMTELIFASGVVIDKGTVYASTTPAAYDAGTGALRWTSAVDGVAGIGGGSIDGAGVGIPGLDGAGETLYVCHLDIETERVQMVAYATADGEVLWRAPLGEQVLNPFERPWVVGDVLVVPGLNGTILGLETADGSERWRYVPPAPRYGALNVAEGRVWTLLQNGDLVALDAATGRVAGQMIGMELELSTSSYVQRPLVRDNTVTVAIGLAVLGYQVEP